MSASLNVTGTDLPLVCVDFFTQNTDITGIGVRVSFYVQSTLLAILAVLAPEESTGAFWSLISMTLGLMVAAIIASVNDQLSWYNANAVSYLVWIGNLAMYFVYMAADFAQRRRRLRDRLLLWLFIFDYVAASGLTIYMWVVANDFGPDADQDCLQHVQYYFMFWNISSLHFEAIRGIANALYACLTVGVTLLLITRRRVPGAQWFNSYRNKGHPPEYTMTVVKESRTRMRLQKWRTVILVLAYLGIMTNFIPPLELYLRQYRQINDDANAQWSFGQVIAMIAIIPPLVSVCSALTERVHPSQDHEH